MFRVFTDGLELFFGLKKDVVHYFENGVGMGEMEDSNLASSRTFIELYMHEESVGRMVRKRIWHIRNKSHWENFKNS